MRQNLSSGTKPTLSAPLPPYVTDGDGCHSCPCWGRTQQAIGHCWCPNDKLLALGSEARKGWLTSFAYICPAHPKWSAQP